jgi:tetratricopeptide (TPR) repeat protein
VRSGLIRRFALVGVALALAAFVARGSLALALVARGDDVLASGNAVAAARYYDRALLVDPRSTEALDRYAFVALMSHDRRREDRAITVLNARLAASPNAALLFDVAALNLHRRNFRVAHAEFARLASQTGSAFFRTAARVAARHVGGR